MLCVSQIFVCGEPLVASVAHGAEADHSMCVFAPLIPP